MVTSDRKNFRSSDSLENKTLDSKKYEFSSKNLPLKKKSFDNDKRDYDDTLIKRLSNLGHGNRDEIADLIISGKVKVNGETITNLSFKPRYSDKIAISDKEIENRRTTPRMFLFHKPTKCLTTKFDPEGRRTIFDILPKKYQTLITVGRLDFNTSGLLLLTNVGSVAQELESPSSKITRVYRVKVKGNVDLDRLSKLYAGSEFEGVKFGKCIVKLTRKVSKETSILKVIIFEGKNQEVRKIMRSQNLFVVKLERISYGPYHLDNIPSGFVVQSEVLHKSIYKI